MRTIWYLLNTKNLSETVFPLIDGAAPVVCRPTFQPSRSLRLCTWSKAGASNSTSLLPMLHTFAENLQIFQHRFTALAPWLYVIDMQSHTLAWSRSAQSTACAIPHDNKRTQPPVDVSRCPPTGFLCVPVRCSHQFTFVGPPTLGILSAANDKIPNRVKVGCTLSTGFFPGIQINCSGRG